VGLIEERTVQSDATSGYILDGFPRTLPQLNSLNDMLERQQTQLDKVISIEVSEDLLMERLCGRWSCKSCGAVMHERDFIAMQERACISCNDRENLYQREDDKPDAIQQRLRTFEDQTAPVKARYDELGLLAQVNGVGSPDEVFNRIKETLK
jgi:adenylate kinase